VKLSLTQQALLLCAVTLTSSGVALLWFGNDARVLVFAIIVSVAMAAFGVRILFSTMRSLNALRTRVDEVAKGNYDVITPVRGIGEIEKLADAFNIMAFRLTASRAPGVSGGRAQRNFGTHHRVARRKRRR